jgi:hypothetical protein
VSFLFRWSVWGSKRHITEMLPYSVGTFHRAFGADARYVVVTDEMPELRALMEAYVELVPFGGAGGCRFGVEGAATWRKWCPRPRLAPDRTEFHVDADVFLVGNPQEILAFNANTSRAYAVMQEAAGSPHWVGRFRSRIYGGMPPVNIGFLGQRVGTDITRDLENEFQWWLNNILEPDRQYHDDQGAVSAILDREHIFGRLELLPQSR